MSIFENGLEKNPANYVPLSPLSFLRRSAEVHPNHESVVYGARRYTWAETYARCRQLASALHKLGVGLGDTVSVMGFNTPETYELHFGVPMIGAVLHAINTRLDAKTIGFMLEHAETKLLFTDRAVSPIMMEALSGMENPPLVVDIVDENIIGGDFLGQTDYEAFLETGDANFEWQLPSDEWQAISLNYTSGTTGNPKGVVYHHRGAYLNAVSNALEWDMAKHPVYLWTLPMFHCNGWCFPWTIAAMTGTNVCLRSVEVTEIYRLISAENISHYCGAPIVHQMLATAPAEMRATKQHEIKGMVAGAPPPAPVLAAMAENGFDITHVYGLTETYGPAVVCEWHEDWNAFSAEKQAELKARQGVAYHALEALRVGNSSGESVAADSAEMGEILFKGNNVMKGYLKNPTATADAFAGGWFHSGDLAVLYDDGYVEIKDRAKDIIISGGENISTVEVESVLFSHPAVMDAAVVAKPDEKWGETPCAFVVLKEDAARVTEAEMIAFCRENMAHFKAPKNIIFGALPKTSTGKTQKYVLRDKAKEI